jgi:hypothetical protein
MPPHVIEKEPPKWKKDEWKSLSPDRIKLIKMCRWARLAQLERKAIILGINPIYLSDDDDLNYKERPYV